MENTPLKQKFKILTLCAGGNVRSVGLRYLLHYKYGHEVLACGQDANNLETREMLCKWADYVIPVTQEYAKFVPVEYSNKIIVYEIGEDRFSYAFHPELIQICDNLIIKHGKFNKPE